MKYYDFGSQAAACEKTIRIIESYRNCLEDRRRKMNGYNILHSEPMRFKNHLLIVSMTRRALNRLTLAQIMELGEANDGYNDSFDDEARR